MHALWAVIGAGASDRTFHSPCSAIDDPDVPRLGRPGGGQHGTSRRRRFASRIVLPGDGYQSPTSSSRWRSPRGRSRASTPIPLLIEVLSNCGDDRLIPHIVWQNLHPLLEDPRRPCSSPSEIVVQPESHGDQLIEMVPRVVDRLLGSNPSQAELAARSSLAGSVRLPIPSLYVAEAHRRVAGGLRRQDAIHGEIKAADADRVRGRSQTDGQ